MAKRAAKKKPIKGLLDDPKILKKSITDKQLEQFEKKVMDDLAGNKSVEVVVEDQVMEYLTKYEKYEIKKVHRSELINAPYNPRYISKEAEVMLRQKMRKVGLLSPIIWNKTSKHIVGGHQRINSIDTLEKTEDYYITVAAVELTDKEEREMNLFLNSTTAQGRFDFEMVADMLLDLDPRAAGFNETDLSVIGYTEAMQEMAEQLGTADALAEMSKVASSADKEEPETDLPDLPGSPEPTYEEKKQKILAAKQQIIKDSNKKAESQAYVTISFSNYKNKVAFMRKFNQGDDELFIKGEVFIDQIEPVI